MQDLILDTNGWYYIANGRISAEEIKNQGYSLLTSPVSILEIVSKMLKEENFQPRLKAIKAIAEHSDGILDDPETYICEKCFGYKRVFDVDWMDLVKALSSISLLSELKTDFIYNNKKYTIGVDFIEQWRKLHQCDFVEKMEKSIDLFVANYKKKRSAKKAKYASQTERKNLLLLLKADEFKEEMKKTIYLRASFIMEEDQKPFCDYSKYPDSIYSPFEIYINAYREYFKKCATTYVPRENDLGDSEFMIYLCGDRKLFTGDTVWADILKEVSPGSLYIAS